MNRGLLSITPEHQESTSPCTRPPTMKMDISRETDVDVPRVPNRSGKFALVLMLVLLVERLWGLQRQVNAGGLVALIQSSSSPQYARSVGGYDHSVATNSSVGDQSFPHALNKEETRESEYKVNFIPRNAIDGEDLYSGMWWQPIDAMLKVNWTQVGVKEGVTFKTYKQTHRSSKHVMATSDWLDMNVEHVSKYVKHIQNMRPSSSDDLTDQRIMTRVVEILELYINTTSMKSYHHDRIDSDSAAQRTIAILPLRAASTEFFDFELVTLQAAATVASLWNVGIRRIVVAGVSKNEQRAYGDIEELIQPHQKIRKIELSYVNMGDDYELTKKDFNNVPRLVNIQFQRATQIHRSKDSRPGNKRLISGWYGKEPSQFEYIYFSEPDLLLHIRPQAMPELSRQLAEGNLLGAHRLNLVPHINQYQDIYDDVTNEIMRLKMETQLLPSLATFGAVHTLDGNLGDVCCDQGSFHPTNIDDPSKSLSVRKDLACPGNWVYCGFAKMWNVKNVTWADYIEKQHLLARTPLISLRDGTGLPLAYSSQRVCIPKRGPNARCRVL